MKTWNNTSRTGVRTTQTRNPDTYKRDIDEKVRSLDREQYPLIEMNKLVGKGKAPQSKKMEVMLHESFDHWDEATSTVAGTSTEWRYMRIAVAQKSRPQSNGNMYYQPQDGFYIPATGQNVRVVMTPDAAMVVNGAELTLGTGLTGNTTTRSLAGTVVVENIEPSAIISFASGDILFTGRTIYESQNYEGLSTQEDVFFDVNYVETMDCILQVSGDQLGFYKSYGTIDDFNWQQEQKLRTFKKSVYYKLWFGERSWEVVQRDRPMITTRGIIKSIKTNVTIYEPTQTDDFERLVSNWMEEQLFRWNPNGKKKVVYCGSKFASNFNMAFREYRRSELSDKSPMPGLNIKTYDWLDYSLKLVIDGTFATGTKLENWAVGIDPLESLLCVSKDFEQHDPTLANERDKKVAWTWQGGLRHHREKSSAILRTA